MHHTSRNSRMLAHPSQRNHDLSPHRHIRPGRRSPLMPLAGTLGVLATAAFGIFLATADSEKPTAQTAGKTDQETPLFARSFSPESPGGPPDRRGDTPHAPPPSAASTSRPSGTPPAEGSADPMRGEDGTGPGGGGSPGSAPAPDGTGSPGRGGGVLAWRGGDRPGPGPVGAPAAPSLMLPPGSPAAPPGRSGREARSGTPPQARGTVPPGAAGRPDAPGPGGNPEAPPQPGSARIAPQAPNPRQGTPPRPPRPETHGGPGRQAPHAGAERRPGAATTADRGPAPDPCATFHDFRRGACYSVMRRLTR